MALYSDIPSLAPYATLASPALTGTGTGTLGGQTIATTHQIPSLTRYAPLARAAFTGTPTIGGNNVLVRSPRYPLLITKRNEGLNWM